MDRTVFARPGMARGRMATARVVLTPTHHAKQTRTARGSTLHTVLGYSMAAAAFSINVLLLRNAFHEQ